MKKLLKKIWNTIFPKECLNCPQTWDYLCQECRKTLEPHPELCPNCHKNSSNYKLCIQCKLEFRNQFVYEWIIVWFRYKDILKKIILKLKYYHKKDLWSFLAERLKYLILTNQEIQNNKDIILTSIPSHWYRKYFIKWYNQSEILCANLKDILKVPYIKTCKKIKNTKSQTELKRNQRLNNLDGSYQLLKNLNLKWNETIIVVDDITTTWSTVNEISKTIKKKYPKIKVWGLVVWRH
jgi:ComF family protein